MEGKRRQKRILIVKKIQVNMNTKKRLLTLTFIDPQLEKEYRKNNALKSLFQVRLAAVLGIILYFGFLFLDFVYFKEIFSFFILIRLLVSIVFLFCLLWTYKKPQKIELIIMIGIVFAQTGHFILMFPAKEIPDYGYSVTAIIIVFLFTFTRIQYIKALFILAFFILVYEGISIFILKYPLALLLKNNFFLLSISIACLLSGYVIERYIRSDFIQSLKLEEKNTIIKATNFQLMEELKLAKKIQQSLIPARSFCIPGISIATFYKPMKTVGGDFYDFIRLNDCCKIGIFISDVSGHGVPAALITSMLKTLLETAGKYREKPSALLSFVNNKIFGQTGGNFLTAFYGIYNKETNSFIYARGAHNPPYLIRNNQIQMLESKGKMLGIFETLSFEEQTIQLQQGDKIIFYTDGLTEACNHLGIEFEELLPAILIDNALLPVEEMMDNLCCHLLAHRKEDDFEDDICIIALEINELGI